jgi:hypothetical protein
MRRTLTLVALCGLTAGCWPGLPRDSAGFRCKSDADCSGGLQCITAICGGSADSGSLTPPLRVAFHRVFYPEAWTRSVDMASLGAYSSTDATVVDKQVDALEYGKVQAAVVFWDGPGSETDARFAKVLEASLARSMRWAAYYEPENGMNPTAASTNGVVKGLADKYGAEPNYLRIDGKPVLFVRFDGTDDCSTAARWVEANDAGAYLVLKLFAGFEACARQPEGWHQYAPSVHADRHGNFSAFVSPGFQMGTQTRMRDLTQFQTDVAAMSTSGAAFQCVESFNDFVDDTAVESSPKWESASGFGQYLDALHEN